MSQELVCGLDIGSSSTRAVIVRPKELSQKGNISQSVFHEEILGVSEAPTRGFSKGLVSNLNLLSDSIEEAINKSEQISRQKVRSIITNISGVHIKSFKSRGSVLISDRPVEIKESDIKRCIESAKLMALSLDREIIHLVPERFYIDDKLETMEPLGLYGSKLDVELNIITGLVSVIQNLIKAINLAGYEVEDMIISGIGTSLAISDNAEFKNHVIIIDLGKDHTELTIFGDAGLKDCFCFPFGGDDLTQILKERLNISFEDAEGLMMRYGIVSRDTSKIFDGGEILLSQSRIGPGMDSQLTQSDQDRSGGNWVNSTAQSSAWPDRSKSNNIIYRREISSMLFPKVEEMLQDILKKIEPFLRQTKQPPSIKLIGGLSKMDGFAETAEEIFGVPVEVGVLRNAKGLCDIDFACCLGLARYGIRNRLKRKTKDLDTTSFIGKVVSRVKKVFSDYF